MTQARHANEKDRISRALAQNDTDGHKHAVISHVVSGNRDDTGETADPDDNQFG